MTIVAAVDAATDDTFKTRTTGPTLAQAGVNAALPTLKAREDARNREIALRKRENAAIKNVLGYTSYISTGTPNAKEVALTFDDGPSEYTPQIVKILDREKVPATFFETGSSIRTYPDVTRALIEKGYAVANHTETHPRMGDLDAAAPGPRDRPHLAGLRGLRDPAPQALAPALRVLQRHDAAPCSRSATC